MQYPWKDNPPIYLQLKELIVGLILDGTLKPGDAAPSVRQIAAEYQINPLTVQRTIQELSNDGLLEKRRGLGMYVVEGASELLMATEREKFIKEEWPVAVARAKSLGVDLKQLLREGT